MTNYSSTGTTYCEIARELKNKADEIFAQMKIDDLPVKEETLVLCQKDLILLELQEIKRRIIALTEKPFIEEGEYDKTYCKPFYQGTGVARMKYRAESYIDCEIVEGVLKLKINKRIVEEKQIR